MSEEWQQRWQDGRIGWHEAGGNRGLKKYWTASGRRVLVPLCGKSLDLIWLESLGNEVVGVELSEIAARSFFDENAIDYRVTDGGGRFVAAARNLSIVCGDYFDYSGETFDAHYDRGALVALPRSARALYAAHTRALLTADATQLVVTVEYDQDRAAGPPFSVTGDELQSYWRSLECVDRYDDLENAPPKFIDAGLDRLCEAVWVRR